MVPIDIGQGFGQTLGQIPAGGVSTSRPLCLSLNSIDPTQGNEFQLAPSGVSSPGTLNSSHDSTIFKTDQQLGFGLFDNLCPLEHPRGDSFCYRLSDVSHLCQSLTNSRNSPALAMREIAEETSSLARFPHLEAT